MPESLSRSISHSISFTTMGCAHLCCARICKLCRTWLESAQALRGARFAQ